MSAALLSFCAGHLCRWRRIKMGQNELHPWRIQQNVTGVKEMIAQELVQIVRENVRVDWMPGEQRPRAAPGTGEADPAQMRTPAGLAGAGDGVCAWAGGGAFGGTGPVK